MECAIRPALADDADDISAVILRPLRETNARDYADEIIERIAHSFSPDAVRQLIGQRTASSPPSAAASLRPQVWTETSSAPSSSLPTFRRAASASC